MENQTERDAAAMGVLGKSAQELNPLIIQGSGALQELAKEAEAAGYVLDESQIAKLGDMLAGRSSGGIKTIYAEFNA